MKVKVKKLNCLWFTNERRENLKFLKFGCERHFRIWLENSCESVLQSNLKSHCRSPTRSETMIFSRDLHLSLLKVILSVSVYDNSMIERRNKKSMTLELVLTSIIAYIRSLKREKRRGKDCRCTNILLPIIHEKNRFDCCWSKTAKKAERGKEIWGECKHEQAWKVIDMLW